MSDEEIDELVKEYIENNGNAEHIIDALVNAGASDDEILEIVKDLESHSDDEVVPEPEVDTSNMADEGNGIVYESVEDDIPSENGHISALADVISDMSKYSY